MPGLRTLHQRMRELGISKSQFPYRVRENVFTVLFITDCEPYELSFTQNSGGVFILFEVRRGYDLVPRITNEDDYKALSKLLNAGKETFSPLVPSVFLGEFDAFASTVQPRKQASPREILEARADLPERDKPYFWHWRDQTAVGRTARNHKKTMIMLGPDAAAYSRKHNLSSIWSESPKEAGDWRTGAQKQ